MSDKHDKLVRQSHAIEPAENFARKIEERLHAEPAEPAPVRKLKRQCQARCKIGRGPGVLPSVGCLEPDGHKGLHRAGSVTWYANCPSVSPYGSSCVYQFEHVGSHGNGKDVTWSSSQSIAQVDAARRDEMLQNASAFQQALARTQRQGRWRSSQLGVGPIKIPTKGTATSIIRPATDFRFRRLLVSDPQLRIVQISVGADKQPIDNVSTAFLGPERLENTLASFDVARAGMDITIGVANDTDVERTFIATLLGDGFYRD